MSSVIIAGDTSGTVTISAPAVAGTPTLTLPTTSGTIVATSGSYVPTTQLGSGTASASNYLRGDQSWATISSGGMTLLGTLTTTSGTTQTLSSLTLTNYKFLQISFNNVGFTSGSSTSLKIAGIQLTIDPFATTTTSGFGGISIDLSTGATSGVVTTGYSLTGSTNTIQQGGNPSGPLSGNLSTISTATTSIAFTWTAGNTFASGTIKVYGVS
jgi:hypothetical protein